MPFLTQYGSSILGMVPAFEASRREHQYEKNSAIDSAISNFSNQVIHQMNIKQQREFQTAQADREHQYRLDQIDEAHYGRSQEQEAEHGYRMTEIGAKGDEAMTRDAATFNRKSDASDAQQGVTSDELSSNLDMMKKTHVDFAGTPEAAMMEGAAQRGDARGFQKGYDQYLKRMGIETQAQTAQNRSDAADLRAGRAADRVDARANARAAATAKTPEDVDFATAKDRFGKASTDLRDAQMFGDTDTKARAQAAYDAADRAYQTAATAVKKRRGVATAATAAPRPSLASSFDTDQPPGPAPALRQPPPASPYAGVTDPSDDTGGPASGEGGDFDSQYRTLPSGSLYLGPDGQWRRKQ